LEFPLDLIQRNITHVLAPAEFCKKAKDFGAKDCQTLMPGDQLKQIDEFLQKNKVGNYFDSLIIADYTVISNWADKSKLSQEQRITAIAIRRSALNWAAMTIIFPILGVTGLATIAGPMIYKFRNQITEGFNRLKSYCKPADDEALKEEIDNTSPTAGDQEESPSVVVVSSDRDDSTSSRSSYLGSDAGNIDGNEVAEASSDDPGTGVGDIGSRSSS
jgi:hypothetical protein